MSNTIFGLIFILIGFIILISLRVANPLKKENDSIFDETRFDPDTIFIRRLIGGIVFIVAGMVLLFRSL